MTLARPGPTRAGAAWGGAAWGGGEAALGGGAGSGGGEAALGGGAGSGGGETALGGGAGSGGGEAALGGGGAARGVRPALLPIVEALDPLPAYVLDACLDVLAFNAAADELFGGLREDANIARLVFTDPAYRARLADPAAVEAEAAGALRLGATREPHNARLRALIDALRAEPAFAALWSSQDVRDKTHGRKGFILPAAGVVELDWERLTVPGEPGLALMVYVSISTACARPGSSTGSRPAACGRAGSSAA